MPAPTQKNRNLEIKTVLGADKLLITNATIHEEIGRPFHYEVAMKSTNAALDFSGIVGTSASVRLTLHDKKQRFFNGIVSRFVQTDAEPTGGTYRMTLVPWLWLLTRTSDCRIFQKKSVPDIIKEVFRGHGFNDFKDSALSGTYTAWDYCVQYRETDFNFVSRLMEHEGIYYYFEHEDGKHTLILSDSPSAHKDYAGYEQVSYRGSRVGQTEEEVVANWVLEQAVQPGTYALNDFNFEKPKTSIAAQSNITTQHAQAAFEMYDYPGEYAEQSEGTDYSKFRIEELHARHEVVSGDGNVRGLSAGSTFTLKDANRRDQNRKYMLTSTTYHLTADDYFATGGGGSGEEFCRVNFTGIDAQKPYRSPRVTPKPLIQGPQTAIVVGPAGEEIYTDQYGRIKVQFHWDRYSKADENSSCWLRVSQAAWAGKKWGAMYIPRIGQEVIVEFLEGDPDLPIVTGRVYNADAMPPYPLPDEKTKTTLKSYSSKGGDGFNEMRFEDKKGEEQFFIHAEKNLDIRVKNNRMENVVKDRHLHVENDKFEKIDSNRHEEVGVSHFEKIGTDRNLTVGGKEAIAVTGNSSTKVDGDLIYEVGGNISQKVSAKISVSATGDVAIASSASITLKVGPSSIAIGPDGIAIKGPMVTVEGTGTVEVKSPATTVKGDGTLILKGGVVMIN